MATITFEEILKTDLRDSRGSKIILVEVTGIEGTYTTGGVDLTPEQFGLGSIQFIGANNFFSFPATNGVYDEEGDWSKAVDLLPQAVRNDDGTLSWKLLVYLYAMDSAELPNGTPMTLNDALPVRMMIMGSEAVVKTPRS